MLEIVCHNVTSTIIGACTKYREQFNVLVTGKYVLKTWYLKKRSWAIYLGTDWVVGMKSDPWLTNALNFDVVIEFRTYYV